jgi:hypothetical protein
MKLRIRTEHWQRFWRPFYFVQGFAGHTQQYRYFGIYMKYFGTVWIEIHK